MHFSHFFFVQFSSQMRMKWNGREEKKNKRRTASLNRFIEWWKMRESEIKPNIKQIVYQHYVTRTLNSFMYNVLFNALLNFCALLCSFPE
jgi:hypothetical protein